MNDVDSKERKSVEVKYDTFGPQNRDLAVGRRKFLGSDLSPRRRRVDGKLGSECRAGTIQRGSWPSRSRVRLSVFELVSVSRYQHLKTSI